jgi:TolA-binding protein
MELVATYPDHARAEQAANLVLDTYNIQEDWTKLNDAARTFSQNRTLMKNKDFKDVLAKVLEESSFKLITAFEKKKQWDEAAKRYLAYGEEFPKSALADKAFANAAAMYTRAGQLDRAIKVRTRLVNDYKDSPLVPDQMFAIASSYEQIVAYRDAATWLEKFVEAYPKDSRARDALFNASIYRHGTGDTPKAVTDREAYLKAFPDVADAEDVAYSVATAWEESGNLKKAIDSYNDFATKWRKKDPARALNAQYKAFRLLEKNKGTKTETDRALADLELQSNAYRKLGKSVDDVGDPLALVAFREADIVFAKFKDLKIAKPDKPADFKKTLQQKREAKDEVYKAYTEVVKLKSPEWAVASLYRIGEANAHLVKAITDVPPPKGLTDEQSQLFRDKLSEQTLPIDDQAAQAMSLCLDKSAEFAVFNDWTRRCLGYLEENRPNTYPKDALELRSAVKIATKPQERGQGYVLELPKLGERPKLEPGSEPPPPPQTAAPAAQPGKKASEFEFDGSDGAK